MKLILASEFDVGFPKINKLLESSQLPSRNAVFIPTAAYGEGHEPDREKNSKLLADKGFIVKELDLREKTESQVRSSLSDSGVIYVGGGNTFYLLECMNKCNFSAILKERLQQGTVYIGSSAGSIVCTPDISYISEMDDPAKATLDSNKGLGLIDILFLPHLDHPFQSEAAQKILKSYHGNLPMLALSDSQILYIEGNVMQVL